MLLGLASSARIVALIKKNSGRFRFIGTAPFLSRSEFLTNFTKIGPTVARPAKNLLRDFIFLEKSPKWSIMKIWKYKN